MYKTNKKIKETANKKTHCRIKWYVIPVLALILAFALNYFFIINAYVPSASMVPAIPENSMVLGNRNSYRNRKVRRGDVVFFYGSAKNGFEGILLVKRILALPGETFEMRKGRVYINGELLDEDYVTEFSEDDYSEVVVPEGKYIVLGDCRRSSYDSRYWEDPFVDIGDIKAKAYFTYFPKIQRIS